VHDLRAADADLDDDDGDIAEPAVDGLREVQPLE